MVGVKDGVTGTVLLTQVLKKRAAAVKIFIYYLSRSRGAAV